MKKVYLSLWLLSGSLLSQAQNVNLNLLANPEPVATGSEGFLTLRICNTGPDQTPVPAQRLFPLVSAPGIATITSVTNTDGSPLTTYSFTISGGSPQTGAANDVRLRNVAPLAFQECLSARIRYRGLSAGDELFSGTLGFDGPQTDNNSTADDNATAGIVVTGATPVSLSEFTAKAQGRNAELSWSTAQEKNNAFFEVQHSVHGKSFETIGQLKGHGTTAQTQHYRFTHFELNPSVVHYYRLKQVDGDGKFNYSVIRAVQMEGYQGIHLSASTQNNRNLRAVVHYGDEHLARAARVSLLDWTGRTLSSQQLTLEQGENPVVFQTSQLSSGLYLIRLENQAHTQALKIALP